MVTQTHAVAFCGIDAIPITVQVQITSGNVAFFVVGLPDKAISGARERVVRTVQYLQNNSFIGDITKINTTSTATALAYRMN